MEEKVVAAPGSENAPTEKLAGKYETPEALDKGYRELHKAAGLGEIPADKSLVGTVFTDAKAQAAAYSALESLYGGRTKTPPTDDNKPVARDDSLSIKPEAPVDTPADIGAILTKAGLDAGEVTEEWRTKGALSAKMYQALGRSGIPKVAVDAFMHGQQAVAELYTQRVTSAVTEAEKIAGGKDQLAVLRSWALANIESGRLARLNAQVDSDPGFYPDMVRLLAADYSSKNGNKGPGLSTGSATGSRGGGAQTPEEFAKMVTAQDAEGILATPRDRIATWNKR